MRKKDTEATMGKFLKITDLINTIFKPSKVQKHS
jgi:hypothetical protein